MATYTIFSKVLGSHIPTTPGEFENRAQNLTERFEAECPGVAWKHTFRTEGRYDLVDIIESEDPIQVERATRIIRADGLVQTTTLATSPWADLAEAL